MINEENVNKQNLQRTNDGEAAPSDFAVQAAPAVEEYVYEPIENGAANGDAMQAYTSKTVAEADVLATESDISDSAAAPVKAEQSKAAKNTNDDFANNGVRQKSEKIVGTESAKNPDEEKKPSVKKSAARKKTVKPANKTADKPYGADEVAAAAAEGEYREVLAAEAADEKSAKKKAEKKSTERKDDSKASISNIDNSQSKPKIRKKPAVPLHLADRWKPSLKKGLTTEQVAKRNEDGLNNYAKKSHGKSYLQIFLSNVFTFFNLIYILVIASYIYFGLVEIQRILFVLPVIANTLIAVFQEIRSKMKLDKLSLVTAPMVEVVRDGTTFKIPTDEIVLDDLVLYAAGKQIASDAIIEDGYLEVDESLLTGESEPVSKCKGEMIFAGSYVLSGHCVARADKIGQYNYVQGLTSQAKKYQKPRSQLLKTLNGILTAIAIIIVPVAVFSFLNNYNIAINDPSIYQAISGVDSEIQYGVYIAAANVVTMIPVGPYLLTSITLAVSILRLTARNTLVQELYCIEMLARVDVLCLDKTGTITDGTMSVENLIEIKNDSKFSVEQIIACMNNALEDNNMTSLALLNKFGSSRLMKDIVTVPFSSSRKLSAVTFAEHGTYLLGAPEFVLPGGTARTDAIIRKYAEQGYRVLMLAHSPASVVKQGKNDFKIPTTRRAVSLIVIEDRIRADAVETIRWFKQNDVQVKVISGDNPIAVSEIARKVGVENANMYVSLDGMNEEQVADAAGKYTVFGRVSPEQKSILVRALKNVGKTVAMTGDGVNDILAMKEADCSIAMVAGSEAARKVAHLVLVDNNFSSMPKVVAEGRRVVNNIQSVAALYYMKIIFTIVLTIFTLASSKPYPFNTSNVLLLEVAIVGIPTTLLAIQPNLNIIKGNFFYNVMRRAVPFALVFIIQTGIIYALDATFVPMPQINTVIVYCYTIAGLFALYFFCKPINIYRAVLWGMAAMMVFVGIIFIGGFFEFMELKMAEVLVVLIIIQLAFTLMTLFTKLSDKIRLDIQN